MAYDSSTYVEIKGSSQSQPSADAGPVARARPEASPSAAPEIDPLTLTTPRERLEYLRDFIAKLPAARFDMYDFAVRIEGRKSLALKHQGTTGEMVRGDCGTAACVAGWAVAVFAPHLPVNGADRTAAELLGLGEDQADRLFYPVGFHVGGKFASGGAEATLTHLLNTGEVDWSVARKVEA